MNGRITNSAAIPRPNHYPPYRSFGGVEVRANLSGPMGQRAKDQPVPSMAAEDADRQFLFTMEFRGGVAQYEALVHQHGEAIKSGKHDSPVAPWPADFVAKYQSIVADGWVMTSAWRVISPGTVEGMLDQIRNRILAFVLEIEEMNPEAGEAGFGSPEPPVQPQVVAKTFNTTIYGGQNVLAAGEHSQVEVHQSSSVFVDLRKALVDLGVPDTKIDELEGAIDEDGLSSATDKPGPAVKKWLEKISDLVTAGTLKLANNVAASAVATVVLEHLGVV